MHINAGGGDCPDKTELHRDILLCSSFFVEYAPQTRIAGEIQQLSSDHAVTERGRRVEGRTSAAQVTLLDSLGFAIEDFTARRYSHRKLAETGF